MTNQYPFVGRLLERARAASNQIEIAEIQAEIACYWARSGDAERAERICQDLRATLDVENYPKVCVLIMCAEGLLIFFKDPSIGALDRLGRANLLSRSMGINDVAAFSSAWMAHINFNAYRYAAMCECISQCMEKISPLDYSARGRLAIVLSDAFLLSRNRDESNKWFSIARDAAFRQGDHTLIASLTYNRAAVNAHSTALSLLAGDVPDSDIATVYSEIKSAINFHKLVEIRSLEQLLDLTMVGVLICKGDFRGAWERSTAVSNTYREFLIPRQRALLSAQIALSAIKSAKKSELADSIRQGEHSEEFDGCDHGDRALILDCYRQIAEAVGRSDLAEIYSLEMATEITLYKRATQELSAHLAQYVGMEL